MVLARMVVARMVYLQEHKVFTIDVAEEAPHNTQQSVHPSEYSKEGHHPVQLTREVTCATRVGARRRMGREGWGFKGQAARCTTLGPHPPPSPASWSGVSVLRLATNPLHQAILRS